MEAISTSETSVNFYQTTRRNNPEDSHLHALRRKNLKSHEISKVDKSWQTAFHHKNENFKAIWINEIGPNLQLKRGLGKVQWLSPVSP
jgi:hypothetical protein